MRQFVFTYEGIKFVTLIGAGEYLSKAKVTPTANVGKYQDLSTAGFQKAFRNDFGQTLLSVPVITTMTHCSCTNDGIFTIHGRYVGEDGKEHSVDVMPDRTVDSANMESAPVKEEPKKEETTVPALAPEPARVIASAPSATAKSKPVTPMSNVGVKSEDILKKPDLDSAVVGMTLGKKKKKKKGITFGGVSRSGGTASAPSREAEQRLGSFPVRPESPVEEVKQITAVPEAPVVEDVVSQPQIEKKVVDRKPDNEFMKKISSGKSAIEALSSFKDSSLLSLPQEKIDILRIIPLDILHMSNKFVNRRAGINFDALKEDGVDYCRANNWQSCDGWWCIDILETAERIFYNSVDGEVYEFDSVVCKDMYDQRIGE